MRLLSGSDQAGGGDHAGGYQKAAGDGVYEHHGRGALYQTGYPGYRAWAVQEIWQDCHIY